MTTPDATSEPAPNTDSLNVGEVVDVRALLKRFSSLEQSNLFLASEVQGLTRVLSVISDLQAQQAQVKAQAEENERHLSTIQEEIEKRGERTRRAITGAMLGSASLLSLAAILVSFVLLNRVENLLDQQRADRIRACETRNEATKSNARREEALAAAETNAAVKRIHENSAKELAATIIDCVGLYRVKANT